MASIQSITSTDNPKIKAAAKLCEGKHRRSTGLFLVESLRDLERAVAAGLRVKQLFLCAGLLHEGLHEGLNDGLHEVVNEWVNEKDATTSPALTGLAAMAGETFDVTEPVLRKLAYRENPVGLVAVVEQPRWSLDSIAWSDDSLLLIAQGLTKPGNLGAMARTAAAAGCAAFVVVDTPIDPFNPNAIRASTGAVFDLPIICADSDACLAMLQAQAVRPFAAALTANARDHATIDYAGRCALVIGAEDQGLSDDWIRYCGEHGNVVKIVMVEGEIDSLNASVATGVLLFEMLRQRRQVK